MTDMDLAKAGAALKRANEAGFERMCLTCLNGFSGSEHCPRCHPAASVLPDAAGVTGGTPSINYAKWAEQLNAAARPAADADARAWLIERGQPQGFDPPQWWVKWRTWTPDANAATQFRTRAEAESVLESLQPTPPPSNTSIGHVTEHVFLGALKCQGCMCHDMAMVFGPDARGCCTECGCPSSPVAQRGPWRTMLDDWKRWALGGQPELAAGVARVFALDLISAHVEIERLRQIENEYRALAMCIGADPDHPADEVFEVALNLWREMKALSERAQPVAAASQRPSSEAK